MNKVIEPQTKKSKKVSQSFAAGAFIMAVGMLIVKLAGAAFKVPLAYILGGVGTGYFNNAYSMYNPVYALATAGLPIAISRMVAGDMTRKRYKDVRMIHKISIPLFLTTGLVGCALMIGGSFLYVRFTNSPGSLYSMFMLAPTVFFSCMISIYKGYFEGLRNMIPTAVSEIVEAISKVFFGLGLAWLAGEYGMREYYANGTVYGVVCDSVVAARNATLPFASAGAVLGITLGSIMGFLYIFIKYKISGDGITKEELDNSEDARPTKALIKMLLDIAVPIALGAIIMNLAGAIDAMLVQRRLYDIMQNVPQRLLNDYNGLIPEQVVKEGKTHIFLAGCFGYMNTVTMLLYTITQGLGISALPNVTTAWVEGVKKKIKKSIETTLKLTSLIAFPAGLGLSVLSFPIMDLIYNTLGKNKQFGEICVSAQIMSIYAIGIIFVAISTPLCSMLQAIGRADVPLKILTVGMVMKVVLNYILVGIPEINIQGAGIGTLVCYLFVCAYGLFSLAKNTGIKFNFRDIFLRPLVCALICAAAAYASQGLLSYAVNYKLSTILAILIAIFVYGIALLLTGSITKDDFAAVPKLKKISNILEKYKLIK